MKIIEYNILIEMKIGCVIFWCEKNSCRPYAHGSVVEVYNSRVYDDCEVEVHSPLAILEPGEIRHKQTGIFDEGI